MSEFFLKDDDGDTYSAEELVEIYKKKSLDLNKFIDDLDVHLKTLKVPEGHIKRLCEFLGEVKVKIKVQRRKFHGRAERPCLVGNIAGNQNIKVPLVGVYEHIGLKLKDIIDISSLEEEMDKIVEANRTDMIYAYQEFVVQFLNPKEENQEEVEEE